MERNFLTLFAFLIFAFFFLTSSKGVAGEKSSKPVPLPNYPNTGPLVPFMDWMRIYLGEVKGNSLIHPSKENYMRYYNQWLKKKFSTLE